MLNVSKPYQILHKVLFVSLLCISLVAASISVVVGGSVIWQTLLLLVAAVIPEAAIARIFARLLFIKHMGRLALRYDDSCDPESFLSAGRAVVEVTRMPLDPTDVAFLCKWACALDDVGRDDEARQTVDYVLGAIPELRCPQNRALMYLAACFAQEQLRGREAALAALDLAQAAVSEDPKKCWREGIAVEEARKKDAMLKACPEEAARCFRAERENPRLSLKARVNAALREAEALEALGRAVPREEALSFAARSGPRVKAGRQAAELLAQTGRMGG